MNLTKVAALFTAAAVLTAVPPFLHGQQAQEPAGKMAQNGTNSNSDKGTGKPALGPGTTGTSGTGPSKIGTKEETRKRMEQYTSAQPGSSR